MKYEFEESVVTRIVATLGEMPAKHVFPLLVEIDATMRAQQAAAAAPAAAGADPDAS